MSFWLGKNCDNAARRSVTVLTWGPKKLKAMSTTKLNPKSAVAAQLRVTILVQIEGLAFKLAF